MCASSYNWPDNFDFETDALCQTHFKPFIEDALDHLKTLDEERLVLAPTHYIFHQHAPRVAKLVEQFALHLGANEQGARNLYWAALPHDIGKAFVKDARFDSTAHIWKEFANKPTDDIFDLRRTHGKLGAQHMQDHFASNPEALNHPFFALMLDLAEKHHECMDGSGPLKYKESDLCTCVRLTAIIEAFDGYCIKRAHFPDDRDTSPRGALEHMSKKTAQFDQTLFAQFSDFILNQKAPQP